MIAHLEVEEGEKEQLRRRYHEVRRLLKQASLQVSRHISPDIFAKKGPGRHSPIVTISVTTAATAPRASDDGLITSRTAFQAVTCSRVKARRARKFINVTFKSLIKGR